MPCLFAAGAGPVVSDSRDVWKSPAPPELGWQDAGSPPRDGSRARSRRKPYQRRSPPVVTGKRTGPDRSRQPHLRIPEPFAGPMRLSRRKDGGFAVKGIIAWLLGVPVVVIVLLYVTGIF